MARAAAVKPPKTISHALTAPGVVQAAQVALVCMKIVKVDRWSDFIAKPIESLRGAIVLTAEQQSLLEEHRQVLSYLRASSPVVSVAACTECERWGLVGSAAVPKKCAFTLRCGGEVVKASATQTAAKK
jgi:hypothetical protein